jgi:hypothetical protein
METGRWQVRRWNGPVAVTRAEPGPPATRELAGGRRALSQWKESPQAQEPPAFGLSMVKPCFSMVSTKSIVAPLR